MEKLVWYRLLLAKILLWSEWVLISPSDCDSRWGGMFGSARATGLGLLLLPAWGATISRPSSGVGGLQANFTAYYMVTNGLGRDMACPPARSWPPHDLASLGQQAGHRMGELARKSPRSRVAVEYLGSDRSAWGMKKKESQLWRDRPAPDSPQSRIALLKKPFPNFGTCQLTWSSSSCPHFAHFLQPGS